MQPRTLSQILGELNPIYSPQVKLIKQQQSQIPQQLQAEEAGLGAKQESAFGDILSGARRRGLGFSGIPLQEQAKYTSTEYLPALARLRQSGREQAMSLEQAILGINERKQSAAMNMRQYEQQRYDQYMSELRAIEERKRQEAAAAAEAARARAASGGGGFSPSFGGVSATTAPQARSGATAAIPKGLQSLFNQMFIKGDGSKWDDRSLVSDYNRTKISAQYGNSRDKQKLQLYHSARPDLFGSSMPSAVFANANQLRF